MAVRQRRYPKEEFARRGKELYEREIRHQVETGNKGKFVAIDIETGHGKWTPKERRRATASASVFPTHKHG